MSRSEGLIPCQIGILIGTTINVSKGYELVYFMWPFAVAAGYSDIALTRRPKQRARSTALALAIYSFILLIAAIIADRIRIFQLIATIMAPLGHEIVIILGQKAELQGKPIFVSPPDGVMVLDVLTVLKETSLDFPVVMS